ncbi:MAG: rhodanese-like domain-containing protein [Gammaproteobacteria bacterium]|nr:rhodanese-like domain-containing protein [Gammaproteobacteria bacterium]
MIENLSPQESWELMQQNPVAVMVDVRTQMEHAYVGHPIGAVHIPWKEAPSWETNPNFVAQVTRLVPEKDRPILLLCRSGQRSLAAAQALEQVGYTRLINIVDGFEGALDGNKHRNTLSGWRFCGLPWEQG